MVAESVHPALARQLAGFVHELRLRTRRRLFPPVAFLQPLDDEGAPNGSHGDDLLSHLGPSGILVPDHALRVDLLLVGMGRMAGGAHRHALVVVRPGVAEPNPNDTAWWRAWLVACGIAERPAGPQFAVVREGWLDVVNGTSTRVPRLRNRSRVA